MRASRVLIKHQPHHGWYLYSSTHPNTITFTSPTSIRPQPHQRLVRAIRLPSGNEPLPSLEGCGLKLKPHSSLANADTAASAPPLSRGIWAVRSRSMKDWGRQNTRGTQKVGGPSSASWKRTTMKVMVQFLPFLPPPPATNDILTHTALSTCSTTPTTMTTMTATTHRWAGGNKDNNEIDSYDDNDDDETNCHDNDEIKGYHNNNNNIDGCDDNDTRWDRQKRTFSSPPASIENEANVMGMIQTWQVEPHKGVMNPAPTKVKVRPMLMKRRLTLTCQTRTGYLSRVDNSIPESKPTQYRPFCHSGI